MRWLTKQTNEDVIFATQILRQMVSVEEIKQANYEDLRQILTIATSRQLLFPTNHFHMGVEVHEAHEDSTEVIYQDYRKTFIKKENNTVRSLSIGSTFNCPAGTAYYIDYYGTVNRNVILEHLLRHFLEVPLQHDKFGGEIILMIGLPFDTDIEDLKKVLWGDLALNQHNNLIQGVMMQAFIRPDFSFQDHLQ